MTNPLLRLWGTVASYIGDPFNKEKVYAMFGTMEKSAMLGSLHRYQIIIWYSKFCCDSFYLQVLTHAFPYDMGIAMDIKREIINASPEGHVVFSGGKEICEHRCVLIEDLMKKENAKEFRYKMVELS